MRERAAGCSYESLQDFPKRNKYGNRKVLFAGQYFDSIRERDRWLELRQREFNLEITDLKRQVRFELVPKQTIQGKTLRPTVYIADFTYKTPDGHLVVEDAKGVRT